MPNTAFKGNAGTEVITDILIFQKHDRNGLPKDVAPWVQSVDQTNVNPKNRRIGCAQGRSGFS